MHTLSGIDYNNMTYVNRSRKISCCLSDRLSTQERRQRRPAHRPILVHMLGPNITPILSVNDDLLTQRFSPPSVFVLALEVKCGQISLNEQ